MFALKLIFMAPDFNGSTASSISTSISISTAHSPNSQSHVKTWKKKYRYCTNNNSNEYFPLLSSFSIEIQMCLEGSTLAFVCQVSSFGVSARAPHSTCRCCSPPFGVSLSLKFCCELCAGAHASRVCKVSVQLTVSEISYALYLCLPFAICHLFV